MFPWHLWNRQRTMHRQWTRDLKIQLCILEKLMKRVYWWIQSWIEQTLTSIHQLHTKFKHKHTHTHSHTTSKNVHTHTNIIEHRIIPIDVVYL